MEFLRKPNDPDQIVEPVELPEGNAILIADVPDYVNLPEDICAKFNLPRRANVIGAQYLPCPVTKTPCTTYILDVVVNGKRLCVAKSSQFYWYTR